MAGFIGCSWCHGKGCIACDAERKKWEAARVERAKQDPRERLAALQSPLCRAIIAASDEPTRAAFEAEIADAQAACDAEYARQFPNGPQPIFTARRGNEMDEELLRHVAHREVIEAAFGPNGGGVAEIEDRAAEARSLQRLHDAAEAAK